MIPTFADGGAPLGPADEGMDLDAQVKSGLEAFVQSQDPAIAVEVCNMLAQMYGIAPEVDPYAGMDAGMGAPQEQVPTAAQGARIYKNGGKIRKFAPGGIASGPGDPKKPATKGQTPLTKGLTGNKGVNYGNALNPNRSAADNLKIAEQNRAKAQALVNGVSGGNSAPMWDMRNENTNFVFDVPQGVQPWRDGDVRYNPVDPLQIQMADSVINASNGPIMDSLRNQAALKKKAVYKK